MLLFIKTSAENTDAIVNEINKESLIARNCLSSPKIDGVLDDECWKFSPRERPFTILEKNRDSTFPSTIKALYDDDNLYLSFKCAEKEINLKKNYEKNDDAFFKV